MVGTVSVTTELLGLRGGLFLEVDDEEDILLSEPILIMAGACEPCLLPLYIYECIYVLYIYGCMYKHLYIYCVCMYAVCMYVYMYVCMYVCMYVYIYVCMYVCMYLYMYIYVMVVWVDYFMYVCFDV